MFECLGWVVGGGGGVWKKECLKSVLQQGREQEKGRSPLAETNYIFRRRVAGHQVVGMAALPGLFSHPSWSSSSSSPALLCQPSV